MQRTKFIGYPYTIEELVEYQKLFDKRKNKWNAATWNKIQMLILEKEGIKSNRKIAIELGWKSNKQSTIQLWKIQFTEAYNKFSNEKIDPSKKMLAYFIGQENTHNKKTIITPAQVLGLRNEVLGKKLYAETYEDLYTWFTLWYEVKIEKSSFRKFIYIKLPEVRFFLEKQKKKKQKKIRRKKEFIEAFKIYLANHNRDCLKNNLQSDTLKYLRKEFRKTFRYSDEKITIDNS